MKILIACEFSGVVRDEFRKIGHDAFSCDLLPSRGGVYKKYHYQCNVEEILYQHWDMIIAHPPCTRLCNSGVLRLYKNSKREYGIDPMKWKEMLEAAKFYKLFLSRKDKVKHIAIENPIMHKYAIKAIGLKKKPQYIQPNQFGEDASKKTGLILFNLPELIPTEYFPPRLVDGKPRWGNQTDSGQNKLGPSETRGSDRAVTYPGIAKAMADQWGYLDI